MIINPCILFDTINNLKIPIQFKNFIRNLVNCRYVNFYEEDIPYGSRTTYKGLPQGSTLSPILFNLYIKDILKYVPYDCKTIRFADDIVIICSYKDIYGIVNSLQTAFNQIYDWLGTLGLELSLVKTQFMMFNRSKKQISPTSLQVKAGAIPIVNHAKYLGIILDSGLR